MDPQLRQEVRERADGRCEYCRIREDQDPFFTFPIDHVIAKQHGGLETLDNLCLSCFRCNAHKGPNLTSIDPLTAATVPLFHPRHDKWSDHFHWDGPLLVGVTTLDGETIAVSTLGGGPSAASPR